MNEQTEIDILRSKLKEIDAENKLLRKEILELKAEVIRYTHKVFSRAEAVKAVYRPS